MKKTFQIIVAILATSMLSGCIVLRESPTYYAPERGRPPVPIPMVQRCAPVARIYGGHIYWEQECEWTQAPAYYPDYGYNYGYGVNITIGNINKNDRDHHPHKRERIEQHPHKDGRSENHHHKKERGGHR